MNDVFDRNRLRDVVSSNFAQETLKAFKLYAATLGVIDFVDAISRQLEITHDYTAARLLGCCECTYESYKDVARMYKDAKYEEFKSLYPHVTYTGQNLHQEQIFSDEFVEEIHHELTLRHNLNIDKIFYLVSCKRNYRGGAIASAEGLVYIFICSANHPSFEHTQINYMDFRKCLQAS